MYRVDKKRGVAGGSSLQANREKVIFSQKGDGGGGGGGVVRS